MKRTAFAQAAVAVLLTGCLELTGPGSSPKFLLLSGVWEAQSTPGSGSLVKIATAAAGGHITGIGIAYVNAGVDSLTIDGQYDSDGSFGMDIQFASGRSAAYAGQVQSTASLSGPWTDWSTGASDTATFDRLPVPPCPDSVPLLGTYDPNAPGFIVEFEDTVDASVETARLGALYGFTPTFVYQTPPVGFAATIPLSTVTVLRCEPKVVSVSYDGTVTTQ